MRVVDVMFAFPVLLLALAIVAILGPGVTTTMLAIGVVYTPIFARVARGQHARASGSNRSLQVSRTMGTGHLYMLVRHILPNIAGPLIVQTSLSLAFAILSEAALSFLGLGIQPPAALAGPDDLRLAGVRHAGVVDGGVPRCGDLRHRAGVQPARRRMRDVLDPKQRTMIEARRRAGADIGIGGEVADPVLSVRDLRVRIGRREIVRGVSFDVDRESDAGHRRRVRFRQVDDGAGRDRPARRAGRRRQRDEHIGRCR